MGVPKGYPMTQITRILQILMSNYVGTGDVTLTEIYESVRPMMTRVYPTNTTVDPTIRSVLNTLVNTGMITRVTDGVYNVG